MLGSTLRVLSFRKGPCPWACLPEVANFQDHSADGNSKTLLYLNNKH